MARSLALSLLVSLLLGSAADALAQPPAPLPEVPPAPERLDDETPGPESP